MLVSHFSSSFGLFDVEKSCASFKSSAGHLLVCGVRGNVRIFVLLEIFVDCLYILL